MNELKNLVERVKRQLYMQALLKCVLAAASAYILVYAVTADSAGRYWLSATAATVAFTVTAYRLKIYQDKKATAIRLVHQTIENTEYSLPLLEKDELNIAERLQIERLRNAWAENKNQRPPFREIYDGTGWYILPLVLASGLYAATLLINPAKTIAITNSERPFITSKKPIAAPSFSGADVTITPPAYTHLPQKTTSDLHISTIQGSRIKWILKFENADKLSVQLANSRGEEIAFTPSKTKPGTFEHSDQAVNSGLYSLRGYRADSLVYQSDFYKLEAIADKAPVIEPASKEVYRYHHIRDVQNIKVRARITDDFEVSQAYIIATVARGSGENVKFREVRFPLSPTHFKQTNLEKNIDLKALNFTPGDELYYYWAATDNKKPEANFTKSDTYFIVYKDTANNGASELATMALDIMPEYFRSQRQIVIDTKKLIAQRKKISKDAFNSTSNEIGFDQKVLRLRYGQYLGEEFETNIGGAAIPDGDDGDILASFEHKSDATEEDHFRQQKKVKKEEDHDHGHEHGHSEEKDAMLEILEQFTHSHDDEEMNTFYEESTRNMLKMALEQMWQSELHLRMFEPEKALPFEIKALEFLKNAQQKVRAFVKKSGFDPPPIKEKEKRLSGELKDIYENGGLTKTYSSKTVPQLAAEVLGYIDLPKLSTAEKNSVQLAGSALSDRLLQSGGARVKDWSVLTTIQKMMSGQVLPPVEKRKLKSALKALTPPDPESGDGYANESALEKEFWKSLQ